LADEIEARVLKASPDVLAKIALSLVGSADARHIQLYFADPVAQSAAETMRWSGRVAAPAGTTDVLAVCNAMVNGSKVNIAMSKDMTYDVALRSDRAAETTLVLGYANTGQYDLPNRSDFTDWLRVYRAPGTVFTVSAPNGGATLAVTDFGLPAEIRKFTVARGQTRRETLTARTPGAMSALPTSGTGPGTAYYRLYLVTQADLQETPAAVTVSAPPGWRVTSASAHLIASGETLRLNVEHDRVSLVTPLRGDTVLEVRFAAD
jgi:hypothetical protein